MQALMLAAGMGKRLGKYTKNATKCMVPVNGKSLIEHAIEALIENNITKFTMVVGYKSEVLKEFLRGKYPQIQISYIDNPIYDTTNNIYSLYLAKDVLVQDDTILLESDLIFKPQILKQLLASEQKNQAIVSHFEPWMDGTVTLLDKNDNINGFLGKKTFSWKQTKKYYKTVNIYKFSKEFSQNFYLPFLDAYQKSYGENEYYEQVLSVISYLDTNLISACKVSGDTWYEIDNIEDLSIAESRFATGTRKLQSFDQRFGGYWRFPNLLDFYYLVNPYYPPKQMVKELKKSFHTLLTQYPSGANEQSLLAGKYFGVTQDSIVVGNGAAELISAISNYLNGTILVPYPTFNEYPERFIKNASADCIIALTTKNFSYTVQDLKNAIQKAKNTQKPVQNVLLINPDNPSGSFLPKQEILDLLEYLQAENITLIFDESFIDFSEKEKRYTLITDSILTKYKNLIVIKSISKSYGVPGLRLGILATGNKDLVRKLKKEISIWNINSFAEYYLQIADKYKSTYSTACNKIVTARQEFIAQLQNISWINPYPSQANYVLCKLDDTVLATDLAATLLQSYNIFIKDLTSKKGFESGHYIRLAVRNKKDNDKLIRALVDYK